MGSKTDSQIMHKAFVLSMEEIEMVLTGKREGTDLTRLASATVSSYTRVKSTEIHEKGLDLMMKRLKLLSE
jgi:hypothetical protein